MDTPPTGSLIVAPHPAVAASPLAAPPLTAALVVGATDLPGATLAGSAGFDTLTLTGGGTFDFTLPAVFTGIATVQGSAAHDTIRIDAARFAGVAAFEGGPGAATTWNELVLVGDAFDLTARTFAGISRISLSTDGAVLTVTGDDDAAKSLALRTGGLLSQHDALNALGLTFTAAEIAALHAQGLDTIRDAAGSHVNAAPVTSGLEGTPLQALAGARVFVDAGRNAAITDDDPSLSLLVVEAPAGPAAPGRLGLDLSGAVSLSGALAPGSVVRVGGVEVGMVWDAGPPGLRVALGPDATAARVSQLVRALTYTFADVLPVAEALPTITVTLSDEGGRVSRASVAMAGLPEPETAHLALSHARVVENARDGTVVGLLTALSAGDGDGFTYSLLSDAGHRFALAGERLVVADGARLDFETLASHAVTVRAVKDGVTIEERFVITLDDVAEEATGGGNASGSGGGGGGAGTTGTGTGESRDRVLVGGAGRDVLTGAEGHDRISGRGGADVLRGGEAADVFVFDTRPGRHAVDRLPDFDPREDALHLDHRIFKALGKAGTAEQPATLTKKAFWTGTAAHDASDRIIYDPRSGKLFYDPDGTGAKAAVTIAVLPKGLKALSHADLFVI